MAEKKRVQLWVQSLETGGTERQVYLLSEKLAQDSCLEIVSFFEGGDFWEALLHKRPNIQVNALLKQKSHAIWRFFAAYIKICLQLRRHPPDVIYSFLPVANIVALSLKLVAPSVRIIWGKRSCTLDLSPYHPISRLFHRCEFYFSRFVDTIIYNSDTACKQAKALGYRPMHHQTIHNGIDANLFFPAPELGVKLREKWGISQNAYVVGMVARFDPVKRHALFLETAQVYLAKYPGTIFLLVGGGNAVYVNTIKTYAKQLGIADSVIFTGTQPDLAQYYNAMNCLLFTSESESCPNAILEALSCGLPVVATPVGDIEQIIQPYFSAYADRDLMEGLEHMRHNKISPIELHNYIKENYSTNIMYRKTRDCVLEK